MFDIEKMKEALESPTYTMPVDLSKEQKRFFIKGCAKDGFYQIIESKSEIEIKQDIKEDMYNKKLWDDDILVSGGLSFFKDEDTGKVYRVSMTNKHNKVVLKWRIKTASGGIFSISAKTNTEAQKLINNIYGKNKYTVSMMLL